MTQAENPMGYSVALPLKAGDSEPRVTSLNTQMARPENGEVSLSGLSQPRARAGLAFMLAQPPSPGEGIEQALDAVEYVIPAVEIIQDDACVFYITGGRPLNPKNLDLATRGVVLEKNGQISGMGAGAQIQGHPARAIIHAAASETLAAGSLVLAAGITSAVDVKPQDNILVRVQDMGSISLRFV